jgi:predicted ATPase
MITKWKVFNFKSIREETELDLGPLTIFAGANSSGKSTFIQSVLLVAQTLANKVGSRSVVLNGALTSLGQFDDLKSNGSESDQITIKWTCSPLPDQDRLSTGKSAIPPLGSIYYAPRTNQIQEIACEISFDADSSSSERDLFQIQPRLFATQLSCVTRDEDNLDQKASIAIRHSSKVISEISGVDAINETDDQLRASLAYEVDLDDSSFSEIREDFKSARPIGSMLRHFLPERIIYAINTIQEDANAIALALQDDGRRTMGLRRNARRREILLSERIIAVIRDVLKNTVDFDAVFKENYRQESLFGSDSEAMAFKDWDERLRTLPREERIRVQQALRECEDLSERIYHAINTPDVLESDKHSFITSRPPRQIAEATWYLDNFFASSLKYLGPLRDAPKPLYPLAPAADPYDVGLRGEHTAAILDLHKNKKIKYIPSASFKSPVINCKTVTRTLESAVIDWLQYLGVASSVKSRDKGKLGHELKVGLSNSDSTHDLTHVGVGVSQVLPILVMCLLADTDSTLVFEQPELHLHPKVQTLLGDFFLSMALCNKQCIVETHSEYFIDRLRYRIAAASSENGLNSQTKIYFVEKPSQGSSFREVEINEYGAISDWPEGFFDQSQQQAEEILRAAAMKRKASRSKSDA